MFVHRIDIAPDDLGTFARELDPSAPGFGTHLNFDQILRRCGHAWMAFLGSLEVFGEGVIVPRLEVDYLREVGAGRLEVRVQVLELGRTSFRLGLEVVQGDAPAARVQVVLVGFEYDSQKPRPLSDVQRAALEAHRAG